MFLEAKRHFQPPAWAVMPFTQADSAETPTFSSAEAAVMDGHTCRRKKKNVYVAATQQIDHRHPQHRQHDREGAKMVMIVRPHSTKKACTDETVVPLGAPPLGAR